MDRHPHFLLLALLVGCGEADRDPSTVDNDGDGYSENQGDCDDQDASVFPDADELCDGIDNDCDRGVDEPGAVDGAAYYLDEDGDGYGWSGNATTGCVPLSGYVNNQLDCDDGDGAVNPSAVERCDGIDNDCDELVDEDNAVDADTWYRDADGDGYGDPDRSQDACDRPSGYVSNDDDCDDSTSEASPGSDEVCDGIDNDCDGWVDASGELEETTGEFGAPEWIVESDYFLGNAFEAVEDVQLERVSIFMQPDSSGSGDFQIYEYNGYSAFDRIASDTLYFSQDDVYGWYDSGSLDVVLEAGQFYVIGFGTDGDDHFLAAQDHPDLIRSAGLQVLGWVFDMHEGTPSSLPGEFFDDYLINMQVWTGLARDEDLDADLDGWTPFCGDCDDSDPDSFPGAEEICGDGIDQDCDGQDLVCSLRNDTGTW